MDAGDTFYALYVNTPLPQAVQKTTGKLENTAFNSPPNALCRHNKHPRTPDTLSIRGS